VETVPNGFCTFGDGLEREPVVRNGGIAERESHAVDFESTAEMRSPLDE
jgi:hypothetical protein